MTDRIVVTEHDGKYIIMFINNDRAVKVRALSDIEEAEGRVYLARVKNVKHNIKASFLTYGDKKKGFISSDAYKPESVIPVMVKKRMPENKEDVLTEKIALSGIYTVVSDSIKGIRFSKHIPDNEKIKFSSLDINNAIIRTNAVCTDIDSVFNEYRYLSERLKEIKEYCDKRTENCILYNGLLELIRIIFSEKISNYSEIVTDNPEVYIILSNFINFYKGLGINIPINIVKYNDERISLKALISFSSKYENATERKVYLKSSSYIVIDYTEALTVIDVNSGTTKYKGDKQAVIHNINIEAVTEAVHQVILRNMSGIIVVDLVNEKDESGYKELIDMANNYFINDECHAKCHGITKLGLMEITRDRVDKTLREQLWK